MFVHTSDGNCFWKVMASYKSHAYASHWQVLTQNHAKEKDGGNYRIQSLPLWSLPEVLELTSEENRSHDKLTVNSPAQFLKVISGKYRKLCFRYKNLKNTSEVDRHWRGKIKHSTYKVSSTCVGKIQNSRSLTSYCLVNYFKNASS